MPDCKMFGETTEGHVPLSWQCQWFTVIIRSCLWHVLLKKLFCKIIDMIHDCQVDSDTFECIKKELNLSYLNLSLSPQRLTRYVWLVKCAVMLTINMSVQFPEACND